MLYKVKILGEKVAFLRLWMAPRESCGLQWAHQRPCRSPPSLDAHMGAGEHRACAHAEGQLKVSWNSTAGFHMEPQTLSGADY